MARRDTSAIFRRKTVKETSTSYTPRSFSTDRYEMGKCWGLSTTKSKVAKPVVSFRSMDVALDEDEGWGALRMPLAFGRNHSTKGKGSGGSGGREGEYARGSA